MTIRIRHVVTAVVTFLLLATGMWAPARAEDGPTITVKVANRVTATSGKPTTEAVAGVTVTVVDATGRAIPNGTGVTAADGTIVFTVPAKALYTVSIDVTKLPNGLVASAADPTSLEVDFTKGATVGSGKRVRFFLGKDTRVTKSRLDQLPQVLVNGIKFSLLYAMASIGLSLIYGTTGLSNFAHGEIVTVGAIVTWFLNQQGPKLHLLVAAIFGIAASSLAAAGMERGIWRPLRRRGMSLTSMMIMSIGIAIGVRYVYLFTFGGLNRRYAQYVGESQKELDFGPFGITPRDLVIMIMSLVAVVAVCLFLLRTRRGKAIRAVSDNPDLASATGIDTNGIILFVWIIGGALAGLGGVMFGAATGVQWDMGFNILLLLFAAITVGGLGNPFGALLGSFVVGMITELWTWVFPNATELKSIAALGALVVVLIVRPQGILGRKERIG